MKRIYKAVPTIARFHKSPATYRGIMGPRGSGKSTGCSMELMKLSQLQEPGSDGIRHTRWAIVRNTYVELRDTTLKTWLMWFDEDHFGPFNRQEMVHRIKFNDIEMEVLFRALDRPKDIQKLLSLELTGAWVNEARQIPKSIIDGLHDSSGRYPPKRQGEPESIGPVIIMDTNPPDEDHWWFKLAEEERPDGWDFFRQPGGLVEKDGVFISNPKAENIENLKGGFDWYFSRVPGKGRDHIKVYYCSEYGFVQEGQPVHPEYIDSIHCSQEMLKPIPGYPIEIGLDFGLTPAALFTQRLNLGRWIWFDELVTENMGATRFAELLGPMIRGPYKDFEFEIWGDPSGDDRAETDERTCFEILKTNKIPAEPAPTNDFVLRRDVVSNALSRMVDGKPGLLISPKCKVTRKGMAGGYHYRRMQVANEERYHNKPEKNKYSHPCEAGQYAMLGAGEGETLIKVPRKEQTYKRRPTQIGPTAWMGA